MTMAKSGLLSQISTTETLFMPTLFSMPSVIPMGEESCSEVSSSSPIGNSPPPLVNIVGHGASPTTSLTCSDIPDDLNFLELDMNCSPTQLLTVNTNGTAYNRNWTLLHDDCNSPIARDDLSPASSNGYGAEPPEKRKKSAHRQSEELCLVCGDRSSGYHYNALTCEGCKGFFRRSITKNAVYVCKYGQNCEMDMYMRRKCQECRFKKCISVGMRPDCVVPEQQCKQKRDQKKSRDKIKDPPVVPRVIQNCTLPRVPLPAARIKGLPLLTKEHQELINRLVFNQERFENPSPQLVKDCAEKLKLLPEGSSERYQQIMEMTKITVELIVEFARCAPGFDSLVKEDQVTLLKASTSEVIALRASRKYHLETDSIVFADNSPVTKESYTSANMEDDWTENVFSFCRTMATMMVDNAEYALLTGMAIFSERPNLTQVKTVEKIQFLYAETLSAYVYNKGYGEPAAVFGKLLHVLVELRSFGVLNNEQCEKFIDNNRTLPELLSEIWDIKR